MEFACQEHQLCGSRLKPRKFHEISSPSVFCCKGLNIRCLHFQQWDSTFRTRATTTPRIPTPDPLEWQMEIGNFLSSKEPHISGERHRSDRKVDFFFFFLFSSFRLKATNMKFHQLHKMAFPTIGAGRVDAYFRSPVVRFGRKCLSSLTKMLNFDVVLDCHIEPTHLITNVVRIFPSEISAAGCFTAGSGQRRY